MIRIYKEDGSCEEVKASILEVASEDGKSALFIVEDADGRIEVLQPGSEKFSRVCKGLQREPAEIRNSLI